ncbi:MAG: 2-hydroxyacyl-CoA dehydratase, partial [Firmicutes bacterium]|nr:2-hydroxyacyl-CoA dehydratase [Bacillota bacterium]
KGAGKTASVEQLPNLYIWKREQFSAYQPKNGKRGTIGLPLALGMYELGPLWYSLFTALDYRVVFSGLSTRRTCEKGQFSIPSDTACYPAKIMHGHMEQLLDLQPDAVFYPCLSYNVDEGRGKNHYNCPVVAYYSELLNGNMERLKQVRFMYPYLYLNSEKALIRTLKRSFDEWGMNIAKSEVEAAVQAGFAAYQQYMAELRRAGEAALAYARENGRRIMILAGRPYHIDPEIGHGIDRLATSLGFVVVSEDSIAHLAEVPQVNVLNQWTYHARLYRAARYAAEHADTELVQLVSFGCGLDAITTDEVRSLLESSGKLYTQIKIDEITNLGAVKIRLRSLLGALEERC